jgi:prepilin-type N-terminal cleavage/methylation domain-containing protein
VFRSVCGFTIVELLVVIALISILASLLLPSIQTAKEKALMMDCYSKLGQFGIATKLYTKDFDGWLIGAEAIDQYGWMDASMPRDVRTGTLWPYYEHADLVICSRDPRTGPDLTWSFVLNASTQFRKGLGIDYDYTQHGRHGSWIERHEEVIYLVEENADATYPGPTGTHHTIDDFYFGAYDYVGSRHAGRNVVYYLDGHAGDIGPGLDFPCEEFQKGSEFWEW